jgi:hypothetical protein
MLGLLQFFGLRGRCCAVIAVVTAIVVAIPTAPAFADKVLDVNDVVDTLRPTIWERAIVPHGVLIESVLNKVDTVWRLRSSASHPAAEQLSEQALTMVNYCLSKNPRHPHALIIKAAIADELGDSATQSAALTLFFDTENIDIDDVDDVDQALPPYLQRLLRHALFLQGMQDWRAGKLKLAQKRLLVAATGNETQVTKNAKAAYIELLQQQRRGDLALEATSRVAGQEPIVLVDLVLLDRTGAKEEFQRLIETIDDGDVDIESDIESLQPLLARMPGSEALYYRAIASELINLPAVARAYWVAYVADSHAQWRRQAQAHIEALDTRSNGSPLQHSLYAQPRIRP